eukprot:5081321-Alexandrium_andersonii.AAC.1
MCIRDSTRACHALSGLFGADRTQSGGLAWWACRDWDGAQWASVEWVRPCPLGELYCLVVPPEWG